MPPASQNTANDPAQTGLILSNLFDAICKLAISSQAPSKLASDSINDGKDRVITFPDGSFKTIPHLPLRRHRLLYSDQFPEFIKYHKERRSADPVLFVNDEGAVVVLNDANESGRMDQACYQLETTDAYDRLRGMKLTLDQKALITLITEDFYELLDDQVRKSLLRLIRKVQWADDEQSRRGTVVRDVSFDDQPGEALPELITCRCSVFTDPTFDSTATIRVHLMVDPDNKKFRLVTMQGDIDKALETALGKLRELLSMCDCPVFIGSP